MCEELGAFYAALRSIRAGDGYSLYGVTAPADVLHRAIRLCSKFGRDPVDYIISWNRFQRSNHA